jgi:dCTP deaminase
MSTMNKSKIKELVNKKTLIRSGFVESKIKESCYEASSSNDFFEITSTGTNKIKINNGDNYILRPNNQVVCVTKEYFDIPLNAIARVFLVGHYFALGIAPVNTYADPGFKGRLGIIFSNTSKNYIKIAPNDRIVKIEFATMQEPSEEAYVGQHGGDVSTWPFRADLVADMKYLNSKNIDPNSPSEIEKVYGVLVKQTIFRAKHFPWQLGSSTLIASILPLALMWGIKDNWNFSSPSLTMGIGVITGIIANTIFFYMTKRFER